MQNNYFLCAVKTSTVVTNKNGKMKIKMHFSTEQTWNFNEVKWIAAFVEFIVIC